MQITHPQSLFHRQKVFNVSSHYKNDFLADKLVKAVEVVVIYENNSASLPPALNDMLDKLLQACKFNPEKVLKLNYKAHPVSLGRLQSSYQPKIVLIFGEVNPSENMQLLKKNHPYEINGMKVLCSETLENLEKSKAGKNALWSALKGMLNI